MDDEASDARRSEGLFWLGSAASLGDPVAALVLGRLHQEGLYGIEVDPCLALDWYGVAAAMGMAAPQRFLAPTVERAERRC
jgi:TPR repeat protein